jgi:C-terminal processing protease CtpA/Prc
MKTMLQNCLVIGMLVILLSSSCASAYQVVPTMTATPVPTPTSTPVPPPYKILSPEDMRSDLDELFHRIETIHPDPYMHRSKENVERDRKVLYEQLSQPMTIVDYYKKVAPLIASLGDDHTQVFPSNDIYEQMDSYERSLPLDFVFKGDKAFIVGNYTGNPDIPLGAELLSVNDIPISEIKSRSIQDSFMSFYWKLWFFFGSTSEYQIDLLPAGESTPLRFTVPGLTIDELRQQIPEQPWEDVSYKALPGEKIGILTVNTLGAIAVEPAFRQIQKDGVQDLIIDIRENGGGDPKTIDQVMNYLTDQPYQKCHKCAFIRPWDNITSRYHGKIYLLIGPNTFSGAVILANILQDHRLATLNGEETTETSSFCAYITPGGDPLPGTGLRYMISTKCLIRPNGIVDGRGVIPDIIVETTIDDMITGKDPVLDYTLKLIRESQSQ